MGSRGMRAIVASLVLGTLPAAAWANRTPVLPTDSEGEAPDQKAIRKYNSGLKHAERAAEKAGKAESATEAKDREKHQTDAVEELEKAARDYEEASRLKPDFHQALSGLGHALRSLGRHEEALSAYDKALAIAPTFSEAIEYRAEAYLGLSRFDDVRSAYMTLFRNDRAQADALMKALETWLSAHPTPEGAEADFASWVRERREAAGQAKASASGSTSRW